MPFCKNLHAHRKKAGQIVSMTSSKSKININSRDISDENNTRHANNSKVVKNRNCRRKGWTTHTSTTGVYSNRRDARRNRMWATAIMSAVANICKGA